MTNAVNARIESPTIFILLIVSQLFCAVFFIGDALSDFFEAGADSFDAHLIIEGLTCLGLITAIVIEYGYLMELLRRKAHLEEALGTAQAAVNEVIRNEFIAWKLTPAERDVATFMVKGYANAEIAALRGCAEGTVKAQLNSIYRKSGGRNRSEVLSIILDGLIGREVYKPL